MMPLGTVTAVISHPAFVLVLTGLALFSIITFVLWKRHNVLWLLYAHLFFLLMPVFLLAVKIKCAPGVMSSWISLCTMLFAKFVIYALPALIALTMIAGFFIVPKVYQKNAQRHRSKNFQRLCKQSEVNAELFVIDKANPVAFTLKNKVFASVGLFELLSKKELEAVMLHELAHVKSMSSLNKFGECFARILSPLAWFVSSKSIETAEIDADNFAIEIQGTAKFINNARKKVSAFN